MSYDLDPSVQEKLVGRSDKARIEDKLAEYPPAAQKRWVANPLVEWLLQGYINGLANGAVGSTNTIASISDKKDTDKKTEKSQDKKDDSDDEDPNMFDLFD